MGHRGFICGLRLNAGREEGRGGGVINIRKYLDLPGGAICRT